MMKIALKKLFKDPNTASKEKNSKISPIIKYLVELVP